MNTMRLAEGLATERFRIVHTRGAANRLADQLTGAVSRVNAESADVQKACELLSKHRVRASDLGDVLARAYPEPPKPKNDAQARLMVNRWQRYVEQRDAIQERRAAATWLFDGAGLGMDHPAATGTFGGLYQAISETENFRMGNSDESTATAVMIGSRGAVMQRAFERASALCQSAPAA